MSYCVLPCVVFDDEMRRREPPIIGREEWLIPWDMHDAHMESTKLTSDTLNLNETSAPSLGMVVSVNRPKLGPKGLGGGAASRTMAEPKCTHLWWVASCDHCESAHGGILQS